MHPHTLLNCPLMLNGPQGITSGLLIRTNYIGVQVQRARPGASHSEKMELTPGREGHSGLRSLVFLSQKESKFTNA